MEGAGMVNGNPISFPSSLKQAKLSGTESYSSQCVIWNDRIIDSLKSQSEKTNSWKQAASADQLL
jgi:hypothetical protein